VSVTVTRIRLTHSSNTAVSTNTTRNGTQIGRVVRLMPTSAPRIPPATAAAGHVHHETPRRSV